jgi:hypothetical protein
MPFEQTVATVRQAILTTFTEVDGWFDRSEELRQFKPSSGGWSVDQILEHITLTNHFLMLVIRRWTEKALRKAQRGEPIPEGESDLARLDIIGERGSFQWVRPEHMEPTGQRSSRLVRDRMQQVEECLDLLNRMGGGEGSLCKVRMSVNDLGKIDLYEWMYFLAQHARRHLHQMNEIEREFRNTAP